MNQVNGSTALYLLLFLSLGNRFTCSNKMQKDMFLSLVDLFPVPSEQNKNTKRCFFGRRGDREGSTVDAQQSRSESKGRLVMPRL